MSSAAGLKFQCPYGSSDRGEPDHHALTVRERPEHGAPAGQLAPGEEPAMCHITPDGNAPAALRYLPSDLVTADIALVAFGQPA